MSSLSSSLTRQLNGNRISNNNRSNNNSGSGSSNNSNCGVMRSSLRILFIAVLSFIGGMQLDRGFIVQIYFDDSRSDVPVLRSDNNQFDVTSPSSLLVDNVVNVDVVDGSQTENEIQVVVEEEENKPRGDTSKPVERIVLLGERHGGTNWITDHLADCFGDRIEVTNQYTRFKHWFQEDTLPENSAVVVALFRDPLDWVEAMRFEPHHAHDHVNYPDNYNKSDAANIDKWWWELGDRMTWKEFVTKPWMGTRGTKDKTILQSELGVENAVCVDAYKWVDVVPCSKEDSTFMKGLGEYKYENKFDGSERGFGSILELRRDKVLNHLSVADFRGTRSFFSYRFEDLKDNGTAGLLKNIEKATDLTANCDAIYGKVRDEDGSIKLATSVGVRRRRLLPKVISMKRELPEDYIRYMNQFVDWEVESKIGYFPRKVVAEGVGES